MISGQRRIVSVNAIVYAAIVEPEEYSSAKDPTSFPWRMLRSSNVAILKPERACPVHRVSSLPEMVMVFQAIKHGKTTLTAGVTRGWSAVADAPKPYRSTVIVR